MPDESAPDWKVLVRERLCPLDLTSSESQEVVAELAGHLDDVYKQQRAKGLSAPEASEFALNQVGLNQVSLNQVSLNQVSGWSRLAEDIQRAKNQEEIMNRRTKHLWLPGLVSLTAAMGSLMILTLISLQPRFLGRGLLQMVILPWLIVLPFCGAAGAYLSGRLGAGLRARLVAGLFPTIVLFTLSIILVLTRLVVVARPQWWNGSIALVVGIVLPSVSLLIGATPFLRAIKPKTVA